MHFIPRRHTWRLAFAACGTVNLLAAMGWYLRLAAVVASSWLAGFMRFYTVRGHPLPVAAVVIAAVAIVTADAGKWTLALAGAAALLHGLRVRVVGLTGGIGSGKSTVAARLAAAGARIIDADRLAREVVRRGTRPYATIVAHFGDRVVGADGELDRAALRAIISHDAAERHFLNSVTHPAVGWEIFSKVVVHRWVMGERVVIDAPLLFESGPFLRLLCCPIIVVTAPQEAVLRRVAARDGAAVGDTAALLAAQMPQERKAALAQYVIANDAGLDELYARVDAVWAEIAGPAAARSRQAAGARA